MKKKPRPNEPCPCGSGRKFKKCCGAPAGRAGSAGSPYTQAERTSALVKLNFYVGESLRREQLAAHADFWGRYKERIEELPEGFLEMSRFVEDVWFAFDFRPSGGSTVVERLLREAPLSAGERAFLDSMSLSKMLLYEVVESFPGASLTLRDCLAGTVVTVHERSASRSLSRHDCLAARIVPRGASGHPEMDGGVLPIPDLLRPEVIRALERNRADFVKKDPHQPLDAFYKLLAPFFHDAWLTSIFEPIVPRLANTDGEEMVITRVSFHVTDQAALSRTLDKASRHGIVRSGEGEWVWSGPGATAEEISLGSIKMLGDVVTVETDSVERGKRARELFQRLAAGAVRYRGTTHEDIRKKIGESLTAIALGREQKSEAPVPEGIDPGDLEALVLDHYSRHYHAWVDEAVPALDGRTPREAARNPRTRAQVEDLIRGMEGLYERALKEGQPAYDPSWMRDELGLETGADPAQQPPLAHERVVQRVSASAEAVRAAAERIRALPDFSDKLTTAGEAELRRDLGLQRFLRQGNDAALAAPYLLLMVNFELHRRKVFWVDAALSYMLENTDIDVPESELRVPFPSFALVFTDRHALSLGERLLSHRAAVPMRGHILRVLTVYVTERHGQGGRALDVVFALDALGADLPSLIRHSIPAEGDGSLRSFLESVASGPSLSHQEGGTNVERALLRLVVNAILYATSAGVTPEVRTAGPREPSPGTSAPSPVSDSVYFLPGKIDIGRVRHLQELERAPGGRAVLARFMVRGHWRRPQKNWTEQRLRWIEPYWKGPDMAAVIEKAYRLKE